MKMTVEQLIDKLKYCEIYLGNDAPVELSIFVDGKWHYCNNLSIGTTVDATIMISGAGVINNDKL